MPANTTPAIVLARAMAIMNGHGAAFEAEAHGELRIEEPSFTGHYLGYLCEAESLLEDLEAAGFWVLPVDLPGRPV